MYKQPAYKKGNSFDKRSVDCRSPLVGKPVDKKEEGRESLEYRRS